ncbi:MAG TPA: TetR/AcrR family transcriptional regulator [Chryseolinea sp.]|nr:TetR/AcrR family transcriptional regulator [Chryseolinea sp.]HPM28721.1 TetR/AcrR family transcriptional regulator [Chryseolinea sp.]
MRNPEATREKILKKSGILFNTNGYKATSISNITDATGFTKGAIYRHFSNKNELERETLAHLSSILFEKLRVFIKEEKTAGDKLRTIFRFFESYISNPPLKGGCPLLNAAIEADDAHPSLRKEAVKTLKILRESLKAIIQNGIDHKQLKSEIDKDYYASIMIAILEGGIMMSKLEGNDNDIRKVIGHLNTLITEMEV